MKFIDYATISISAGNGGNGAVAFRREKYISKGGPSGGNGGSGGNVLIQGNTGMTTLLDFKFKRKIDANHGSNGRNKNMNGPAGDDVVIQVPLGTVVIDENTDRILIDVTDDNKYLLAKGGKGGLGNAHFKSSVNRAPKIANNGNPGQKFDLKLELKVLADVGLVGLPNVGKSTLLSAVTNAKPQIANYAFTTINPQLGLVRTRSEDSFVIADLPGLIEGASLGKGLGDVFLKHIERCRIIVHILDLSLENPEEIMHNYKTINHELSAYKKINLTKKPMILVANKMDSENFAENFKYLEQQLPKQKIFQISGLKHKGLQSLTDYIGTTLKTIPLTINVHNQDSFIHIKLDPTLRSFKVNKVNGAFIVSGQAIDAIMQKIPVNTYENLLRINKALRNIGVWDMLEKQGVKRGDSVSVGKYEFQWGD